MFHTKKQIALDRIRADCDRQLAEQRGDINDAMQVDGRVYPANRDDFLAISTRRYTELESTLNLLAEERSGMDDRQDAMVLLAKDLRKKTLDLLEARYSKNGPATRLSPPLALTQSMRRGLKTIQDEDGMPYDDGDDSMTEMERAVDALGILAGTEHMFRQASVSIDEGGKTEDFRAGECNDDPFFVFQVRRAMFDALEFALSSGPYLKDAPIPEETVSASWRYDNAWNLAKASYCNQAMLGARR